MPRLLANEFVYAAATTTASATNDQHYGEYNVTPSKSSTPPPPLNQRQNKLQTAVSSRNRFSKSRSRSPPVQRPKLGDSTNIPENQIGHLLKAESHNDGDVPSPGVILSDEDEEDFRGFDENDTPNNSDTLLRKSHHRKESKDSQQKKSILKRSSHSYHEDFEGAVEAIEVDDDEDIEEVDGKILLKSKPHHGHRNSPHSMSKSLHNSDSHTPSKRKKKQTDNKIKFTVSPMNDNQIVEINSDSTTVSQKQKRHEINSKYQRQIHNQNKITTNVANKCSTESTSEFPVSSPSNPQQPRNGGGKYPSRPPLLKNTLPGDTFERQLALITAGNPQMSLSEKIQNWCCDEEFSDVEDVQVFDQEFKRLEEQRKLEIKLNKNKKKRVDGGHEQNYDFSIFKQKLLNDMKIQNYQRYYCGSDGGLNSAGLKNKRSTASDSSKSGKYNEDRPSTSAIAQQLHLRRLKLTNLCPDAACNDGKKRFTKDLSNRNQNSTTPPATSSSENDRVFFAKNIIGQPTTKTAVTTASNKKNVQSIQVHDKMLCPSSSDDANSQDAPPPIQEKKKMLKIVAQENPGSKNLQRLDVGEIDSVFRLHRLNREIDKQIEDLKKLEYKKSPPVFLQRPKEKDQLNAEEEDKKKGTKKQEFFKTPIIPPKYLGNVTSSKDSTHPTITAEKNNFLSGKDTNSNVKLENVLNDSNLDGVYHQQHEFCNYLGLTGMSTATAMANAVAELAQCNLTRRSMRVLRQQQQQDRKEKAAVSKDDSREEVTSSKTRPIYGERVKKSREKGGYDAVGESEESAAYYDEGSYSQKSESFLDPPIKRSNINIALARKSSANLVESPPVTTTTSHEIKPEPQIKILCHIATSAEKKLNENREFIPKENAIRRTTQQKVNNINDIKDEISSDTKSENSNEDEEDKYEDSSPYEDDRKKSLRFDVERRSKLKQKNLEMYIVNSKTGIQLQKDIDFENSLTDNKSDSKTKTEQFKINQSPTSPFSQKEMKTKDLHLQNTEQHLVEFDDNRSSTTTPTSANMIKDKLQAALKESRKTKPSIFIVQSLECMKEKTIIKSLSSSISELNNNINDNIKKKYSKTIKSSVTPLKVEIKQQMSDHMPSDNQSEKSINHKNKNKKYVTKSKRKVKKNIATEKRKLRSHKDTYITKTKSEHGIKNDDGTSHNKKEGKIKISKTSIQTIQSIQSAVSINSMPSMNSNISMQSIPGKLSMQTMSSDCTASSKTQQKRFRNAQTETKDLEIYNNNNNMIRTRLMAKAAALLLRSRSISLSRGNNTPYKLKSKLLRPSIKIRSSITRLQKFQPKSNLVHGRNKKECEPLDTSEVDDAYDRKSLFHISPRTHQQSKQFSKNNFKPQESETVVVSSTTNSFDERPSPQIHHSNQHQRQIVSPITLRNVHSSTPGIFSSKQPVIKKHDSWTQIEKTYIQDIEYLKSPPSATHIMRNPLNPDHGVVLHMYYERDVLIVVQEKIISFWKCSHFLSSMALVEQYQKPPITSNIQKISNEDPNRKNTFKADNLSHETAENLDIPLTQPVLSSSSANSPLLVNGEWIMLGELKRLTYDYEIYAPYTNRICLHNSTPIYVEMRGRPLPKHHRDCNLLSMYINIYFYHEEDTITKSNSIQLDTIQSDYKSVNFTTLKDSRYFILTWPQENLMGKSRSGLCKYSLTPQLDTLASIREFRSMRHTIKYLECTSDDKLIGLGYSQLTLWDHRSGDILMNYDLKIPIGINLGAVHCASPEFEKKNIILLFQWHDSKLPNKEPELMVIACTVSHSQPSYRILYRQLLPMAFKNIERAINTGDHLIIIGSELENKEKELWISCQNPALMALVSPASIQDCKRFYNRGRSQLLELTEKTLNLDTLANHNLNLAAAGMAFDAI